VTEGETKGPEVDADKNGNPLPRFAVSSREEDQCVPGAGEGCAAYGRWSTLSFRFGLLSWTTDANGLAVNVVPGAGPFRNPFTPMDVLW